MVFSFYTRNQIFAQAFFMFTVKVAISRSKLVDIT